MISFSSTMGWRSSHSGAMIGLCELSNVALQPASEAWLEKRKKETEESLHQRYRDFSRQDLLTIPVMAAYDRYYKRFKKTFHVLLQLESILIKSKHLPRVSPLVDVNFISEVETCILTAGHDVSKLKPPILIDVSGEDDCMVLMSGEKKKIYPGDMIMRDEDGICCSIIYGQDNRSLITPETNHVLYVSYAPAGVPQNLVETHLNQIANIVRMLSPQVHVDIYLLSTTVGI